MFYPYDCHHSQRDQKTNHRASPFKYRDMNRTISNFINRAKKTWLRARNMLVIGFFLPAGMAAAQNLATNPGFETGTTTGWTTIGSPTISAQTMQVHSGSYAGLVTNRTATYAGIAQSFQGVFQANQTYNISAWVRLVSGTSQTMQLTVKKVDGSGIGYSSFGSSSVSSTGWSQLTGQYTFNYSGTLTSLVLYAEMPSSTTNAYYVDDLLVQLVNTTTGQCTVDWTNMYQRIDGFGASSAWRGTWTSNQANMFFSTNNSIRYTNSDKTIISTNNGIGLSLLRNHIAPANTTSANDTPSTVETAIMQMAKDLGARIWSAPWTPASGFKLPVGQDGGSYQGSGANATNLAYASQLANYVVNMKNTYGINLYAISIQNEPDADVTTYEACYWNAQQIHDFTTNLYNALVASNVSSTKIMLPESEHWQDPSNLTVTAMTDSVSSNMAGIIACHNYDGATGPTTLTKNSYGKALWETEVSLLSGSDSSITNGVYYGQRIYQFMTVAQANAFHYWWLIPANSTSNQGLMDTNANPTPRMFVFGQYSRFVRPGYYRIGANNTGIAMISAYNDTNSGNFAIVAVNTNSTSINQTFNLTNFSAASVTPWMTTSNLSLASQSPVAVSGSSFAYTLPALSVVTFVGQNVSGAALATTTVTLTSGANPSTYGNTITFTATVKTNNVAVSNLSGETVTFYNGATQLGAGTLNSSGQAAYITSAAQLSATTHSITAGYGGDTAYAGSTNAPALSQTINKATLTAELTGTVSKTYNGTTTATLVAGNYTMSTVMSGDTVTLNNPTSGTYDTKNQGASKTVSVTGLTISGASASNYTLSSTSVSAAVGTISAATLTYTANMTNIIFGSSAPVLYGSVGEFVGSDTQANATTGTLTFTTPATSSSGVGSYAINGSGLTANDGNYTFAQAAGNAAALSILPLVTPAFASPGISAGSVGWQLSFSAQAGQSYKVLTTGDLTLPVGQWTIVTNGTFGPTGVVIFTDGSATSLVQRFYQIVSP